jgi:2-polyprenyl-3-methyl-5-hydroxy-6-metoxy-1,4-benzoquinol methylase
MTVPTQKYNALNRPVFEAIPLTARKILDLGCGTGTLGRAVKARQHSEVTGITYSIGEAVEAGPHLDRVIVGDLNVYDMTCLDPFDCIVCSRVLEHLYYPDKIVRSVQSILVPGGRWLPFPTLFTGVNESNF